ncbi:hypothetical protein Patl1_06474 [Pistacia atlantica]|uniref:Uncharacterized protein n=1 Tax=Pistacia atlantica TaxID=434234 RepID=A0ACC1BNY5_9ROSI|nr:hypothetical protein Patl1_06474 [Pistacia atlantica]
MGDRPDGEFSASLFHASVLQEFLGSGAEEHLLHSYHRSFNGFLARLTQDEAQRLKAMEGVVSVFPNGKKQLHTTRSWDFMGFSQNVTRATTTESGIIIGMLDSGIWPESESFNDTNFGPPPKKWKGTCQTSSNFTCNNKIIGAKYYRANGTFGAEDFKSPRDSERHGTYTSSTAAGGVVSKANQFGLGLGTARGGVPSARIAMYKICWSNGCDDANILAAFDDAIADGVDIISVSVEAVNVKPWSLSVAGSTIDRKFVAKVNLGNGHVYEGISINTLDLKGKMFPLIYGGDAPDRETISSEISYAKICLEDSLNKTLVRRKMVLCDELGTGNGPAKAGAAGCIMQGTVSQDAAFSYPLPAS